MTDLTQLEKRLGVTFKDQSLLRLALMHPSYVNEQPGGVESNQRLEFLGDALLGMVVAQELYRRHPYVDEGELTEFRSYVVRGRTLAVVARRLGLNELLQLGQGEAASGGDDRESNLAAVFEAVAGAVLLDRGYRIATRFALRVLKAEMDAVMFSGVTRDAKSLLQHRVQRDGMGPPRYEVVATGGPAHRRWFTVSVKVGDAVLATGSGSRRVDAESQAAAAALAGLEQGEK
jgi:ribonuclease-3